AFGFSQELIAKSNQATRRCFELKTYSTGSVVDHLCHLSLTSSDGFGNHSNKLFGAINNYQLNWLESPAITNPGNCFGFGDLHLITFPAHHFDENRQLQLATT